MKKQVLGIILFLVFIILSMLLYYSNGQKIEKDSILFIMSVVALISLYGTYKCTFHPKGKPSKLAWALKVLSSMIFVMMPISYFIGYMDVAELNVSLMCASTFEIISSLAIANKNYDSNSE